MEAENETAKNKVHRKTALESLRVCLFCNAERDGVKKTLDHMRTKHSFFLIDVDCLTNLKGLLTYLAEKIHIGQMCVFCNKIFKDPFACQQHMLDKRHCFMNIEDFEVEYEKFYDFSKTYVNYVDVKGTVKVGEKKGDLSKDEQAGAKSGDGPSDGDKHSEGWEDCDVESGAEEESDDVGHEVIKETVEEHDVISEEHKDISGGPSSGFEIVNESEG